MDDPFITRLLSGPNNVKLSAEDLALLEAYLRQPVSYATIQRERKALGHSPTQQARNKLKLIHDYNRGLQASGDADEAEKPVAPAPAVASAPDVVQTEATPGRTHMLALLRVFTNGIVEDKIKKASQILANEKLTVNEKLTKIDALIPFPATASAEQLGEMLGVTKQAVQQTAWWTQNRKGKKEDEVGRRRERHRQRAKNYEPPGQDDES